MKQFGHSRFWTSNLKCKMASTPHFFYLSSRVKICYHAITDVCLLPPPPSYCGQGNTHKNSHFSSNTHKGASSLHFEKKTCGEKWFQVGHSAPWETCSAVLCCRVSLFLYSSQLLHTPASESSRTHLPPQCLGQAIHFSLKGD